MGRVCTALAGLVLGLGLAPAAARAQNPGANDPGAGSPAGTIYQIPLDTARHDAAPRGRGGSSGGRGDVSPIRSNNNFGSSSTVPGAGASGDGGGGAGSSASSGQQAGGAGSSGSSAGSRAGSGKAGRAGRAGGSTRTRSNDRRAGNREALIRPSIRPSVPSSTRTYLLIALGIAVAIALAVAGRVVARRR